MEIAETLGYISPLLNLYVHVLGLTKIVWATSWAIFSQGNPAFLCSVYWVMYFFLKPQKALQ
jgi:hypothetical protein